MRILAIGSTSPGSTDLHRASAMERLGHDVVRLEPDLLLRRGWLRDRLRARVGYRFSRRKVARAIRRYGEANPGRFDVAWVSGGREVGTASVAALRTIADVVVNYNHDDPFGKRDGALWGTYRSAVPAYDLIVVRRLENVPEAAARGARRIMRIWLTFDERVHNPAQNQRLLPVEEHGTGGIVFLGAWEPDRGPVVKALIDAGLPFEFWGLGWKAAPEWASIRHRWKGPFLTGEDYTNALLRSKVVLGLVSAGNRDQHTHRTLEASAAGVVLCAQRTREHEMMLGDARSLLWSDTSECVAHCRRALADPELRERLSTSAQERVWELGLTNEGLVGAVLAAALGETSIPEWPHELATAPPALETAQDDARAS